MKNLILFFLLSFSLLFASCSSEIDEPVSSDEYNTVIEIQIPSSDDIRTRAFSDGLSVNNLKCYVYDTTKPAGSSPILVENIPMHNYSGHMGAHYSLLLPKNSTYELVLLASSCPQDNTAGKIYYNQTARTINVNYDVVVTNDESLDCFWGVIRNVNPDNSKTYQATLKRPFAQLNIGTKDLADYNAMASSSLQSVAVAVTGVYSSMNVMDGKVNGKTNLSFPASALPSGQTFPVSGYDYLSMNYLLVNERTNVDVTLTARNQTKSFDCNFSTIPLQRNYRTNIYGKLLTATNDYKVEIEPGYDGREDKDVDLYDLIFKVEDGTDHISLYYTTPASDELKEIDLSSYIDSNNTVKVSWEGLGITDANSIRFMKRADLPMLIVGTTRKILPITEFIVFNIDKLNLSSFEDMFLGCSLVEDFSVINSWNTSNIVSMRGMFCACQKLIKINTSNFDTQNVRDMSELFRMCSSLEEVDISHLNTSNVSSFRRMFGACVSLAEINLSNMDTSNAIDMSGMFSSCHQLTHLDLSKLYTPKLKYLQNAFCDCYLIKNLDASHFNTKNVVNIDQVFYGCHTIQSINISGWDISSLKECHNLFAHCYKLEDLYINFDCRNFDENIIHSFFFENGHLKIHGGIYNLFCSFYTNFVTYSLHESVTENFINNLPTVSKNQFIRISNEDKELFAADLISEIENRGWTWVRDYGLDTGSNPLEND